MRVLLSTALLLSHAMASAAPPPEAPPDIPTLILQLGDESWERREEATARLIAVGLPAVSALEAARAEPDAEVRSRAEAILEIVRWGVTPALRARVGPLLDGFGALDPSGRMDTLQRLVQKAGTEAAPVLERVLLLETDDEVLEQACGQFESVDADAARRALRRAAAEGASPWAAETLGARLEEEGDSSGALAVYEAAQARWPGRPTLQVALAGALLAAGEAGRAREALSRLAPDAEVPPERETEYRERLAGLLAATGRSAEAVAQYTKLAERLLSEGGGDEAFLRAAERIAVCLRRLGRGEEVEPRWRKLLDGGADGDWLEGRLRLADLLRRDGQGERVEAVLREALLAADPHAAEEVREYAANLLALAGRHEAALAAYREMAKGSEGERVAGAIERQLRFLGRAEEALQVRIDALAADPDNLDLHLTAAESAARNGLFDRAEALLREAVAAFPEEDFPRHILARLRLGRGMPEAALALGAERIPREVALECYEALGRHAEGAAFGDARPIEGGADRLALARLYRRVGRIGDGLALLDGAEADQEDFDSLRERARLLEAGGRKVEALQVRLDAGVGAHGMRCIDMQEARREAERLAAAVPDILREAAARQAEPGAERRRSGTPPAVLDGELKALAGDYRGAAEAYERLAAECAPQAAPRCRAAEFLARAGDRDAARRRLEAAARAQPDSPLPYRLLEELARADGDAAAADRWKARAAEAGSESAAAAFEAARQCLAWGRDAWARAEFRKVLAAPGENFHEDTNAREYLGHLALRAGDWAEAAGHFRQVLEEREIREELSATIEEGGVPYAALLHYARGRDAEARGDPAAAAAAYARAAAFAPSFADARAGLARTSARPPR